MIEQKPNQKNEREFESHFLSFCRSFQSTILVKCLSSFFLSFPFFRHPPNIIEDLQYPGPFIRLMGKLPTRISKQHFATWWDVEELSFSFNDGHDFKRALSMMTHWAILQMREISCGEQSWSMMINALHTLPSSIRRVISFKHPGRGKSLVIMSNYDCLFTILYFVDSLNCFFFARALSTVTDFFVLLRFLFFLSRFVPFRVLLLILRKTSKNPLWR